jgi:hypothetical protein
VFEEYTVVSTTYFVVDKKEVRPLVDEKVTKIYRNNNIL